MTDRRTQWLVLAVSASCLGALPGVARAQFGSSGVGGGMYGGMPGMGGNPYASPYMNPFLNPYLGQTISPNMTAGNAALYMFAAQQANGGIGSGQLSGVRPPRGGLASKTPAKGASANSSMVPGGNAAHYFNQGTRTNGGLARYYNNQSRYFPKNGR